MSPHVIDATMSRPCAWLGLWIRSSGQQDSAALRRELAYALGAREYAYAGRLLGRSVATEHLANLRRCLVAVWGEPEAHPREEAL